MTEKYLTIVKLLHPDNYYVSLYLIKSQCNNDHARQCYQ